MGENDSGGVEKEGIYKYYVFVCETSPHTDLCHTRCRATDLLSLRVPFSDSPDDSEERDLAGV